MRIKFWVLTLAITLTTSAFATTFLFEDQASVNQTIDGITVVLAQGGNTSNGPTYLGNGYTNAMRLYNKNTITVTGDNLTNIQLLCSKTGKAFATITASTGTYTPGTVPTKEKEETVDTWTGNATSVVFTMGDSGQRNLLKLVVNGDPIEVDPEKSYIDTTALDPNFEYTEPTLISVPEMSFTKQPYAFILNNIRVSCPMGSILNNDTVTTPFFNCNANNTLTFEATKPMKGLAIAGMVRKQFEATVEEPITISYCSPGQLETDWEGDPVVIVKDINANSVTISCPKQVRCYQVRVYFEANPTEKLDCEGSEDIQNTESEKNKDEWTKVLREEQLLLQHKDKVFTVTGQAL